jgi:hypothetical protein
MNGKRDNVGADRSLSSRDRLKQVNRSLKVKAVSEFKQFLVIFFYLWILFALFACHQSIVLAQHHVDYKPYGFAFVNAFVLAKVMLVAEKLNLGQKLRHRPLLFPILYKSIIFALILITFEVAEEVAVGLFKGKTIIESIPSIGGGSLIGVVTVAIIISVSLIPFFVYREVDRVIGRGKLRAILLKAKRGAVYIND